MHFVGVVDKIHNIRGKTMCDRLGEKATDRGITWKPLVSVGCLSVLSRIFWCVVSWFKSSQTCKTTCALAGCDDIVHGPFKERQKCHRRAWPQSLREQLNCKHLRDFNSETRGWGCCVHSGFKFTRDNKGAEVQSYCTTFTYLQLPEKAISMATWSTTTQLHKHIYRKSSTKSKHWLQQIHWCGCKAVLYFNNNHSSKNLK